MFGGVLQTPNKLHILHISYFFFENVFQAIDQTDLDATITYRIVSGNTPTGSFVLNSNTGELTLKETVNYEQTINRTGM